VKLDLKNAKEDADYYRGALKEDTEKFDREIKKFESEKVN
jgi:hypothetical protein